MHDSVSSQSCPGLSAISPGTLIAASRTPTARTNPSGWPPTSPPSTSPPLSQNSGSKSHCHFYCNHSLDQGCPNFFQGGTALVIWVICIIDRNWKDSYSYNYKIHVCIILRTGELLTLMWSWNWGLDFSPEARSGEVGGNPRYYCIVYSFIIATTSFEIKDTLFMYCMRKYKFCHRVGNCPHSLFCVSSDHPCLVICSEAVASYSCYIAVVIQLLVHYHHHLPWSVDRRLS